MIIPARLGEEEQENKNGQDPWLYIKNFFAIGENKKKFERLHNIYKYMLTLPCTQVPCERSFSILRNVKNVHQTQLGDETLETYLLIDSSKDLLPESKISEIIDNIGKASNVLRKKLIL